MNNTRSKGIDNKQGQNRAERDGQNEVRKILVSVLATGIVPHYRSAGARDIRDVVCISKITTRASHDIPGDHPVDFHGAISMQIALSRLRPIRCQDVTRPGNPGKFNKIKRHEYVQSCSLTML